MQKNIVLFIAFLDILGFAIFIPALPEIASYFGISIAYTWLILTVYAFFSFLFTPILGQLSDKFGRKKVLFLSVIGTFFWNLLMYFSPNFWIFLVWRMIDGATWWNISVIQSILSDISKNKQERTKNMAYIWALFWIWFIIGPFLWWFLLKFWINILLLVLVILSIVEIWILFLFKETIKEKHSEKISYNPLWKMFFYLKNKDTKYLLFSFFFVIFAVSFYQLMLPVYLNVNFWVSGEYAGYIMWFAGIVGTLNQIFFLKKFWLNKFTHKKLIFIANIWLSLCMFWMAFIWNLYLFIWFFLLNVIFMWVFRPVYTSEILENVKKTGEILGVISSLRSLTMIFTPILSSILIESWINIFIVSMIFVLVSVYIIYIKYWYDKNS